MSETFAVHFIDGPRAGETDFVDGPWPLAERIGEYAKVDESRLAERQPGVVRGAAYRIVVGRPVGQGDDSICPACGGMTVRTGTCHTCTECGSTTGCG